MRFLLRGLLCGSALFSLAACVLTAPPRSTSSTTHPIEIIEMSSAYKGGVCAPTQKNTSAPAVLPSSTGLQTPKTAISDTPETGVNAAVTPASSLPSDLVIYEEIEEPVTLGALPSNSVTADTGH